MNLQELKNKSILLLGKTRALNKQEFEKLLDIYAITCKESVDESVVLVIDGAMMSPYHQNEQDRLYEKGYRFESIDTLEKALCSSINPNTLMMSLKLSNNQERLQSFLKNPYIDNTFFLKLLSLYRWNGESFFESDENRDVTAALIRRFYKNIERNHNVEYANTGLSHLLAQTDESELIRAIAMLEPIENAVKKGANSATHKILQAIVLHKDTSDDVLLKMIRYANSALLTLIASREPLSSTLQESLICSKEDEVLKALSCNNSLEQKHIKTLLQDESYRENILLHVRLNDEMFNSYKLQYPHILAQNITLSESMMSELFDENIHVRETLASNEAISTALIEKIIEFNSEDLLKSLLKNSQLSSEQLGLFENNKALHVSLASNKNSSTKLLQSLSNSEDKDVILALAKNPSTPVDILFQLQLDARFERAVHENPAFGAHIQKENLGWL
jgi:hypothetical protein